MTTNPRWERLSQALERVMATDGRSKEEAQTDICRAIADREVNIRGKLERHTPRGTTASNTILEGKDFHISEKIKSDEFDWDSSRPLKPWALRKFCARPEGRQIPRLRHWEKRVQQADVDRRSNGLSA